MPQTILITGGTGKFGRQFVEYFLKKEWTVAFTTTNQERGESLLEEFTRPEKLIAFVSDLTKPGSVGKLVGDLRQRGCSINHLVNNARSLDSLKTDSLGQSSREDFLAEYLMDVVVPYELSMALFNTQPDELKTITNIGSQYGLVAANPGLYEDYPKQSPIQYGVAKAALGHLTKELAVRLAPAGVRVNCIAYGGVEGRVNSDFLKRYATLTPSGRMLNERELAGPLEAVISDSCSAITGQTIAADGGWTLW
ncbi:MAG: SDR family oxidoreductase [Pseudomonadales bacterium]|nr:SDR family oxidoreductase [Pseudomonadales bacterium]